MEYDFRRKATPVLIGLLLLLTSTFAFGQGITTGSISSTIQDQQQAVVSGAKVTAVNTETNQEFATETNSVGGFALRSLPIGTYTVTIEAPKFQKLRINSVPVLVNRDTALGTKTLTIGTEEIVNVESTPPLVESMTSQIAASFESQKISRLPADIFGNFDNLALLVPGVVDAGDNSFSNSNGANIAVNGQRGRSNNFQIDGQANNDNSVAGPSIFLTNPDLLAEFVVVTNNFSAEYGRNMGSQVNYVTKSGTNSFHGTLFELHRNSYFSSLANDDKSELLGFCAPGDDPLVTGCDVPKVPRNIVNTFGGTFGGPVVKDKLWFFGSASFVRQAIGGSPASSGTSLTPTPTGITQLQAFYPGNPAVNAIATSGPFTRAFGNPQVTGTPVMRPVGDGTGVENLVEFGTIQRFTAASFTQDEATGKGDWQISSKDRLTGSYIYQKGLSVAASNSAGFSVDVPFSGHQVRADWTRNWSSTFVNQFRWSYAKLAVAFEGGTAECTQATFDTCVTRVVYAGTNLAWGLATNLPQSRVVRNMQFQDNVSWVRGRHTFKFGGEFDRQNSPAFFLPVFNGQFTMSGSTGTASGISCATLLPTAANRNTANCSFSRFLANRTTLSLADGDPNFPFNERDLSFYFQDDWRIKDNLTLNIGVRWEWNEQAVNLLADRTLAQETGPAPQWNTALPLDRRTVPVVPEDFNNWSPNIGFAWTPRFWQGLFGQDKTVVRGGFRIAYDPAFYNIFLNMATAAPTVNLGTIGSTAASCTNPAGPLVNGFASCFPASGALGSDVRALDLALIPVGADPGFRNQTHVSPDFHNPYTQQWSLGVQRTITNKIAAEVRYVGNHTVGNFQTINANPRTDLLLADFPSLVPSGFAPCSVAVDPGTGLPNPGFGTRPDCSRSLVRSRVNGAFSIYHGLQSRLDFSNWHGLTAGVAHTWSRTIDNVSEIFSTAAAGTGVAGSPNPFDPTVAERGLSGVSFPHVFSVYWIYDLPWYKSQQGVLGHLLGGWGFSGNHRFASGQPYNPLQFVGSTYCDQAFYIGFFGGIDTCRPILGNPSAPLDVVGFCADSTLADCGLTFIDSGDPATFSEVHWIYNDSESALFFGSPYLGVGRNTLRSQTTSDTNIAFLKQTKITERVKVEFRAQAFNVLNRQFLGTPDTFVEDGRFADPIGGSFNNNFFNTSNRRTLSFGLKVIF